MIGRLVMLLIGILLVVMGWAGQSGAGVDVNVGIYAPPPAYVAPAPPPVVVIPGSYVYLVPGISVDILFYHGYWWRPYQGHWYRSGSYNGPWGYYRNVPHAIVALPPDYRRVSSGGQRIPYVQLRENWNKWEKEKHWDSHGEGHGHGEVQGHPEGPEHGEGHGHGGDRY